MSDGDEMVRNMVRTYGCDHLNGGEFPNFWQDPISLKDFRRSHLRKYLPRVLVALLWYYICVYVNNLSQAWLQANMAGFYESEWGYSQPSFEAAQKWLKEHEPSVYQARWGNIPPNATKADPRYEASIQKYYANQTVTLYDVAYLYLPMVSGSGPADFFAGVPSFVGSARFIVLPGPMSLRWTYTYRVLFVWGALFLCRAFTTIVTPLPNPYHQCVPKITFPKSIWAEAFANLPGVFWWSELTCQDVMFSGHTAMGTVWTVFTWRYMRRAPWFRQTLTWDWATILVDIFACCWLLWGWYVICAAHFHYTVDVMIGAILTFTLYNWYHNLVETIWLKEKHPLKRTLAPFFMWFEVHAVDLKHFRLQAQDLMSERLRDHRWLTWRSQDRSITPPGRLIQTGEIGLNRA